MLLYLSPDVARTRVDCGQTVAFRTALKRQADHPSACNLTTSISTSKSINANTNIMSTENESNGLCLTSHCKTDVYEVYKQPCKG